MAIPEHKTESLKNIWLSAFKLDRLQVTQVGHITEMHLCSPTLLDLQLYSLNMHIKNNLKAVLAKKPQNRTRSRF